MSFLLKIAFVALLSIGLYNIAAYFMYLPGRHIRDLVRYPHGKPSFEEQAAKTMRHVTAIIARILPLSEYKRQRYNTL